MKRLSPIKPRGFRQALADGWIFPVLSLLVLTAKFVLDPIFLANIVEKNVNADEESVRNLAVYILRGNLLPELVAQGLVVGLAMFTAVQLFRFTVSRKMGNVYFSLGVSRTKLFVCRYGAGVLLLSAAVLLPFLAAVGWNISQFGSSAELWKAAVYLGGGYLTLSLFAFSVTVCVIQLVGTWMEGLAFSSAVLLGPTALAASLQQFALAFLPGTPFGVHIEIQAEGSQNAVQQASLLSQWIKWDPCFFLYAQGQKIGLLRRQPLVANSVQTSQLYPFSTKWEEPLWTPVLLWLGMALLAGLLAWRLFHRRGAEQAGCLWQSKILNSYVVFLGGMGVGALSFSFISVKSSYLAKFGMVCAAFLLVYFLGEAVFVHRWRAIGRGLWKLPLHCGLVGLVTVVLLTGGLGAMNQVPSPAQVEKAYVTMPVPLHQIPYQKEWSKEMYGCMFQSSAVRGPFDSTNDLILVQKLHEDLLQNKQNWVESGKDSLGSIAIVYQMKDGSTQTRCYSYIDGKAKNSWLALTGSDYVRQQTIQMLKNPVIPESTTPEKSFHTALIENNVWLADDQACPVEVSWNQAKKQELRQSLAEDWEALTWRQQIYPNKVYGSIVFSLSSVNESNTDDVQFPITDAMPNTLTFLKEQGWLSQMEGKAQVLEAALVPVSEFIQQNINNYSYTANRQLMPQSINEAKRDAQLSHDKVSSHDPSLEVIEQVNGLRELKSKTQKCAYMENGGYLVLYRLDNGRRYCEYLSEENMTSSLKTYLEPNTQAW